LEIERPEMAAISAGNRFQSKLPPTGDPAICVSADYENACKRAKNEKCEIREFELIEAGRIAAGRRSAPVDLDRHAK